MVNFLKKYKIFFLIAVIVLFIVCLFVLINSKILNTNQKIKLKSDLKGYEVLKQGFEEFDQDTTIPKNARYQRLKSNILSLENPKLSKKEKYGNLTSTETDIFDIYFLTKNNKLYVFNKKITDFAKINFPEYYKKEDLKLLVCFNSVCADSPQPKEILDIVQEMNSSSLPEEVKKIDTEILISYSYTTKDQAMARVENYYFLAQMIKKSPDYEKAGLNIKISNEIIDYLKKNYPDLLSEISGVKN